MPEKLLKSKNQGWKSTQAMSEHHDVDRSATLAAANIVAAENRSVANRD